MESPDHSLVSLFEQLGLDTSAEAIEDFIVKHKPVARQTQLHQANFWSRSQAAFLRQAIEEDADWANVVDHLDSMLR